MDNDWKKRLGIIYSTNPDFVYRMEDNEIKETPEPSQQKLYVSLEKKNRKGKTVTLISGFTGNEEDLRSLGKLLKSKCGVGGTVKNGQILIQGDFREKISDLLLNNGYQIKRSGG
ncbi:MAG TPA: translation initiation factor [Bacteroidaceae bacterium]|nr:translation initiation factor [Bacteroidaceae bacterium]